MPAHASRPRRKPAPLGETGQEALYLRFLSEKKVPVQVKLRDGEIVLGWIEYFDDSMIRLTRDGKPNLFIYKQQIRTISELVRKDESRKRAAIRKESVDVPAARGEAHGVQDVPGDARSQESGG